MERELHPIGLVTCVFREADAVKIDATVLMLGRRTNTKLGLLISRGLHIILASVNATEQW